VLPFYGHLRHRLYRDDILFITPFYAQSRKKDVVTDNYLYPFFHLRHGDALQGWQFWPLTGYEHKNVTTRTNREGEVETLGGFDKFFALWPVFFNQRLDIGAENPAHHQALLPLYSYLRSPQRDSTTLFWPLGVTVTDDLRHARSSPIHGEQGKMGFAITVLVTGSEQSLYFGVL